MLTATPDLVEWNDVQLTWDFSGAHPFGYWTTLDDRKESKMCYGKEQTTHKETSSRFYAECIEDLLYDFQYERANELDWLLEKYEEDKEDYIEDLESFYYDNYSGDFDDFYTFQQIIHFKNTNGGITYGQINEIVDDYKGVYDEIIYDFTKLHSDDFYTLLNSDDDYVFSGRRFTKWFYDEGRYEGRIWTDDYIMCMYDDADLTPGEMRRIITDLSKSSGISVMTLLNYTYLRDTVLDDGDGAILSWTVRGFIHGEEPKVTKDEYGSNNEGNSDNYDSYGSESSRSNEGRPLHLKSPYEKWRALKDFRRNRDKIWGEKLRKSNGDEMTMAQYHNLIRQENKNRNMVRMNKNIVKNIIKESINKILKEEFLEIEDIPTYDAFNENMSLSEINEILESNLYDNNDKCIGKLSDFHFKYDTNKNRILGSNSI